MSSKAVQQKTLNLRGYYLIHIVQHETRGKRQGDQGKG